MSAPPEPPDQPPVSSLKVIDRQREHQANERTFLAWLRTALSLIGFGFAIARFNLFCGSFRPVSPRIPNNLTQSTLCSTLKIWA